MNNQIRNVYIWDMDETLILLKSLLTGTYAEAFSGSKDAQKGVEIGKMWEKHILQISDDFFFYEQIENCNKPFLEALSKYDDGRDLSDYDFNQDGFSPPHDDLNKSKLAYRHRVIANKYKQGLHNIFDQEMMDLWDALYKMTDEYTDGWLSSARTLLEQCLSENEDPTIGHTAVGGIVNSNDTGPWHINVLVTSGSLIPSLVKCLLFRLDGVISYENDHHSFSLYLKKTFNWKR
ncbi:hypothetical protein DITRI_Ditri04bG0092900 [Diplodiscus trichospermus]